MKKFLKWLGIGVGILLVLLIVAIIAIYLIFPPSKVLQIVETKVEETTSRDVEIGSAALKFSGGLGFKLNDFMMSSPPGFEQREMVRLSSLELNAKLMPLFRKNLEITQVMLNDLQLNLVVKADSTNNFTFGEEKTAAESAEPASLPASFTFPLNLSNGQISYIDHTSQQVVELKGISNQVNLNADAATNIIEIALEMNVEDGTLTRANEPMLPFSVFPLTVDSEVSVSLAQQSYQIRSLDLGLGQVKTHITSTGEWRENAFKLVELGVTLGKTHLSAQADLSSLEPLAGAYGLELSSDLNDLTQQIPMTMPITSITGAIQARFQGNIQLSEEENLAAMLPDGTLKLTNVNIVVDPKYPKVEEVSGALSLQNKALSIDQLGARIGESSLAFDLDTDLSGLKVADDWRNLSLAYALRGDIDLAEIKQQAPPDFPLKTLSGKINLDLRDTVVPKTDLENYSRLTPDGTLTLSNINAVGDSIPEVKALNGKLTANSNGTIKLENLKMLLAGNDLNMTGQADLRNFKTAEDWEKAVINFALNSQKLDLNTLLPPPEEEPADPEEPIVLPLFPAITITSDFAADQLIFRKYDMRNVTGKMELRDRVFALKDLKLNIFSGLVHFAMAIDSKDTTYVIKTDVEGLKSNEYFATMYEPLGNKFFGTLFFDAEATGKGLDPEAIKKNLISNGLFKLTDGKVTNLDFLQKASSTVNVFNFDEVTFHKSDSDFRVEDGRFYFDQLTIDGEKADYTVDGNTSFEGELDFRIRTLLTPAQTAKINMPQKDLFLNDQDRFVIDLKVTGKGTGTRVVWDKDAVMKKAEEKAREKVEEKVDEAKDKVKDELKDKGKDLLDGLFKK